MFNNLKGNKKKVMAGGISLVLAAAIVAGIVAGVRSTTSSTVINCTKISLSNLGRSVLTTI